MHVIEKASKEARADGYSSSGTPSYRSGAAFLRMNHLTDLALPTHYREGKGTWFLWLLALFSFDLKAESLCTAVVSIVFWNKMHQIKPLAFLIT